MEKVALFYKKLKNDIVQCYLCPKYCTLKLGERGNCRARINKNGKLYSLVYASPVSVAVDPIEKKPLFHFLPGSYAYSVGTAGCNLRCLFCQNWQTSQALPESVPSIYLPPQQLADTAARERCQSVAYTYNEPNVFYEYVYDTAPLARKKGLKNVIVTNGYINKNPVKELYKFIDAANVDLKGFTEDFYKKICFADLKHVLDTLKLIKKMGVWVEITNLIIPTMNDNMENIEEMCKWIKRHMGKDCPLHFSRFFPCYQMLNLPPTPFSTLKKAYDTAKETGLKYVYIGNVGEEQHSDTYCPKCNEILINRSGFFQTREVKIKNGRCFNCKEKIPGIWK